MRIGVFAYNFPHWKTQAGLQNMKAYGFVPDVVFAQDWKKLDVPVSSRRIAPKDIFLVPSDRRPGQWLIGEHNDQAEEIKKRELDIGVILGARILSKEVIDAFRYGIINLHPGILPDNRGLDNVKWALIENIPQGATVHFIDEKVDRGKIVMKDTVNVYPDDTLMDLHLRVQGLEQKLLIDTLIAFEYQGIHMDKYPEVSQGMYHTAVPDELDRHLDEYLDIYKDTLCLA